MEDAGKQSGADWIITTPSEKQHVEVSSLQREKWPTKVRLFANLVKSAAWLYNNKSVHHRSDSKIYTWHETKMIQLYAVNSQLVAFNDLKCNLFRANLCKS